MWKIYFYIVKILKALKCYNVVAESQKKKKTGSRSLDLVEIVHGKKEMYLFSKEKNNVVFFP